MNSGNADPIRLKFAVATALDDRPCFHSVLLEICSRAECRTVRPVRKAKTKSAHHVLMELAIAALNARLYGDR
jgi:hypothetical protein